MSDDLLERATSALRETTADPAPELVRARERARLLARTRTRRASGLRPQSVWQWAAVLLLGFFVSTAMAHVIRVEVPRLWRALREQPPESKSQARPAHGKKAGKPRPEAQDQSAQPATAAAAESAVGLAQPERPPVAEPALPETVAADSETDLQLPAAAAQVSPPAAADVPARAPAPARRGSHPRAQPVATPQSQKAAELGSPQLRPASAPPADVPATQPVAAPAPVEPADLVLFRRAQALHLARDARAIEAWDAYLRAADHGALVPEARYNRALCLVRGGRYAEARSALAPFAEGAFAGYRQREAQALLSRLPE